MAGGARPREDAERGGGSAKAAVVVERAEAVAQLEGARAQSARNPHAIGVQSVCAITVVVERAEVVEQLEGAHERLGRRRVHEVEVDLHDGAEHMPYT